MWLPTAMLALPALRLAEMCFNVHRRRRFPCSKHYARHYGKNEKAVILTRIKKACHYQQLFRMKRYPLTAIALLCIQAFSSGMNTKNELVAAVAAGDLDKVCLIATKTGTTLLGPIKVFDAALLELTATETLQKPYRTTLTVLASYCSQEGLAQALYTAVDTLEVDKVRSLASTINQPALIACALYDHLLPIEQARPYELSYRSVSELIDIAHAREKAFTEIQTVLTERLHRFHSPS